MSVTNTFTQLQTGLNRWSEAGGGWVPASAQIERVNGTLVARQTQHQVIFGDGATATNGTIDLLMVNSARFRVRPTGIAYTEFKDGQPGKSVFIAELQQSTASLTASDQVTYFAAFDYGDLAYDLLLAGLEQNVVFRQRPPRPEDLQMDPRLVRVECWNQIYLLPYYYDGRSRTAAVTNNLVERTTIDWTQGYFDDATPFAVYLRNNLIRNSTVTWVNNTGTAAWGINDNLFENVSRNASGIPIGNSNNGYSTNTTKLYSGGSGDVTITNFDYQTSFLGDFYYPTSGGHLSQLLNADSRTASSAGLSAYTTTTNQMADSGTVDIGYHSFAVSTNTTVTIQATTPITTENGSPGAFTVFRTGSTSANLTVFYKAGGTAVPGTDYQSLSNKVTIGTGNASQEITVTPIENNAITFDKTVIASLILTNTYFVGSPGQATLTIQDNDEPADIVAVAMLNAPVGIDYHQRSMS